MTVLGIFIPEMTVCSSFVIYYLPVTNRFVFRTVRSGVRCNCDGVPVEDTINIYQVNRSHIFLDIVLRKKAVCCKVFNGKQCVVKHFASGSEL